MTKSFYESNRNVAVYFHTTDLKKNIEFLEE